MLRRGCMSFKNQEAAPAKLAYDLFAGLVGTEGRLSIRNKFLKLASARKSDAPVHAVESPYDFIVNVQSVEALCQRDAPKPWSVWVSPRYLKYLNQPKPNEDQPVTVVSCLGYYSKGKSTVLNLIHAAYHYRFSSTAHQAPPALSLSVGSGVTTVGLSGKFVGSHEPERCPTLFLDVAGRNAPADQFRVTSKSGSAAVEFENGKRAISDMRAREHVTDRAAFDVCDVLLYVMDEVLNEDQRFLLHYIYNSKQSRETAGKTVVLVHNLKRLTAPRVLEARIREVEDLLKAVDKSSGPSTAHASSKPAATEKSWFEKLKGMMSPKEREEPVEWEQRKESAAKDKQRLVMLLECLKKELSETKAFVDHQLSAFRCSNVAQISDEDRDELGDAGDYLKQSTWPTASGERTTVFHIVLFGQSTSVFHNFRLSRWISKHCFLSRAHNTKTAYNVPAAVAESVTTFREDVIMQVSDEPSAGVASDYAPPHITDPNVDMRELMQLPLAAPPSFKYVTRPYDLLQPPAMSSGEVKLHCNDRRETSDIVVELPGLSDDDFKAWDEVEQLMQHGCDPTRLYTADDKTPKPWWTYTVVDIDGQSNQFGSQVILHGVLHGGARQGAFREWFSLTPRQHVVASHFLSGVLTLEVEEQRRAPPPRPGKSNKKRYPAS